MKHTKPTARAMALALRTYHRPVKDGSAQLETWDQVVERVIAHQRWLWERALNRSLNEAQEDELAKPSRQVQKPSNQLLSAFSHSFRSRVNILCDILIY